MANLVTLADVRTTCGITSLIVDGRLQPWLTAAQAVLEKVLGRTGYAALIAAHGSDPTYALTANADWLALQPYFEPYLCWETYSLAAPHLRTLFDVKGDFTFKTEEAIPSSDEAFRGKLSSIRTAKEAHLDMLLNRLQFGNYSWYSTNVAGEQRIDTPIGAGISFRRSRRQNAYGLPNTTTSQLDNG